MPNKFAHFAIEADDVDRARSFYENVFEWTFEAWGPPDFYLIHNAGVHGALQQRSEPLAQGRRGFDCTFAVTDLELSISMVVENGGEIGSEPFTIPEVGRLVKFVDTEGNEALIMQYEPQQLAQLGL